MIGLADGRRMPPSQEMTAQIEEINDRLRVVAFAVQGLTLEGTVDAAEDAVSAIRALLVAVQEFLQDTEDGLLDQPSLDSGDVPALPLNFEPMYDLGPADYERVINGLVNVVVMSLNVMRGRGAELDAGHADDYTFYQIA